MFLITQKHSQIRIIVIYTSYGQNIIIVIKINE